MDACCSEDNAKTMRRGSTCRRRSKPEPGSGRPGVLDIAVQGIKIIFLNYFGLLKTDLIHVDFYSNFFFVIAMILSLFALLVNIRVFLMKNSR